ncbi:MAG: sigma-70 family RNA polymerase sigma factor [Planctomycetota bacterium]
MTVSESSIQLARKYELLDPDVRLMLEVRDDNAAAFEQLVAKYQSRLIGVLDHLVPARGQAEDLAQEVFMRVYRARHNYVPKARFSTWLFTITNNVASNAIRKLSRKKEVNLVNSPSGSMPVQPLESMAKEKSALMPARQIASSEASLIVREAIQGLNDRQRMALLLSKFEDMSYLEIAETMGMSTQAVKSLLSRARSKLRDILEPYVNSGQLPAGVTDVMEQD